MVEFLEDDSSDQKKIMDGNRSDDIPPEMKLLWVVQMNLLFFKSPRGYRWHPRYSHLCIYFFILLSFK